MSAPSMRSPMDTRQTIAAARTVLSAASPMLWIVLTDRRDVASVQALPPGVDPNPPGGAFRPWILVGDGHAATDATLERAILLQRSAQPKPRLDDRS